MTVTARRTAALLAVALGLAGCGGSTQDTNAIRIWHWMTDREQTFVALADRYEQERGVPVRFELYAPSDLYVQKVRSAAQTNGLPDVFGVLGETRDFASFIRAGHILRLSEIMEHPDTGWGGRFYPISLAMNSFDQTNPYGVDPGIYGVPIDMMSLQIFYNKRLLGQLGGDPERPPRTWDEFLALGQRAKEAGLIGFVSGWAELWLIDALAMSYAIHLKGQDWLEATFRGEVPYTDETWVEILGLFEQLRDSGLLAEGIVTMVNKRAEQLFAQEQAVMAFNGTWGVNVYHGMRPGLEYGLMMPPAVRSNRPMVTLGGAGSSFMVNAKSSKRDDAVAFLEWLTNETQQQALLEATNNIPANQQLSGSLPPELAAFADDLDDVFHPRLFGLQERGVVIEAFDKGVQQILIGERTPLEVAQAVQKLKEREEFRRASGVKKHAVP